MFESFYLQLVAPVFNVLWKLQIFLFPAELILLGTYVLYRFFEPLLQRALKRRIAADIIRLLVKMLRVIILFLGVITALGTIGVDVTGLVAGFGLTGFAVGFAMKDALANLLAGVMILLYRPFRENDFIGVLSYSGRIVDIDLRYTHIVTEEGIVLIPNTVLLNNPVSKQHRSSEQTSSPAKPRRKKA
ncbi:MAG: mechanosensitive ion channel [Legionellales bacterium]|jgi:small conductance mechanosensitive channel|nr:mechanosensitive ion channel [Legionellales bacterium]|tara:strand:- start:191 stop:754 length:564 start_codon:yes stop_codon:yes gene_type:complete